MKNIMVQFEFQNATTQQYDQVWEDLKAAGQKHPKGLIFHVASVKHDGNLLIVDVWDSEEHFQDFSKTLMPIITKNGGPQNQPPIILPVHNIYSGEMEHVFT
jgi:heme-degrading monooxygenase HmoA